MVPRRNAVLAQNPRLQYLRLQFFLRSALPGLRLSQQQFRCDGHQRRGPCAKPALSPNRFFPAKTICDKTLWVQNHRQSPRMCSSESKYPHNPHLLWWRRMENHYIVRWAPYQSIEVYRLFCSQLWFHWGLHRHYKKYGEGYVVPPQIETTISLFEISMALFTIKYTHLTHSISAPRCIRQGHSCLPPIILSLHCCNTYVSNLNMPKSLFSFSRTFRDTGLMMMAPWAWTTATVGDQTRLYVGSRFMACSQFLAISRKK